MNNIVWLTMRRMRTPLIIMILVYSFSVFGMLAIPGQDEAGNPVHVGFLHAGYFVAIMATTIGFGEVPNTFTAAQRLYTYAILFPNVIAWLYSIGTIISLFVDPQFRAVLALSRFSRNVRRIRGDYYIVCGFGYTGRMIVAGLLKRGISAAIIEREEKIIQSMKLSEDFAHLPAIVGSVTDQNLLDMAGLNEDIKNCIGVIAITNKDHVNLTIAITSKATTVWRISGSIRPGIVTNVPDNAPVAGANANSPPSNPFCSSGTQSPAHAASGPNIILSPTCHAMTSTMSW